MSAPAVAGPVFRQQRTGIFGLSDDQIFDLLLLFIPILGIIGFRFTGEILASDLLVPFALVAGLACRGMPSGRAFHIVLIGLALWMVALVASDVLNHTSASNYLRGWARNGLICIYLIAFACLLRPNPRSMTMVVAGLAICLVVRNQIQRAGDFTWFMKMGGGQAIMWVLSIWAMYTFRKGKPVPPILAMFLCTALALAGNVRSIMVTSFGAALLCIAAYYGHRLFRRVSIPVVLVICLVGGGALAGGLVTVYSGLVSSGALGKGAKSKYDFQARGSTLEEIWNARPELRVASAVIGDSPILGHGSWYYDPKVAAAELLFSTYIDADENKGAVVRGVLLTGGQQAMGHSIVLQSWVESGILGAAFWIWVLGLCVTVILRNVQRPTILSPLLFMAAVSLSWDTLFSPLLGIQRVTNMIEFAIILVIMTDAERRAKNSARKLMPGPA